MTTVHNARSDEEGVENRLKLANKALSEAESKVKLFKRMIARGLATTDITNFAQKQAKMTRSGRVENSKIFKVAMRSKLHDACALASKLRRERRQLRKEFMYKHRKNKVKREEDLKRMVGQTKHHKKTEDQRNMRKFTRLEVSRDSKRTKEDRDNYKFPKGTSEMLSDLHAFNVEITPEKSQGPMICSKDIVLSEDEYAFLCKGPGFMLRDGFSREDFMLELELAITKRKFGEEEVATGDEDEADTSKEKIDSKAEERIREQEAKCSMIYDKESKHLDIGNLKATGYKFNRYVSLPTTTDPRRETLHGIRREETKKILERVIKDERIQ